MVKLIALNAKDNTLMEDDFILLKDEIRQAIESMNVNKWLSLPNEMQMRGDLVYKRR